MNALKFLLAALVVATPAAAQDDGKRYAVLVGVNDYDHAKLKPLKYAEADAAELRDVLKAAGYETTLLTTAAGKATASAAPTKANVEKALAAVLDKGKRRDTILVCLAGHGLQFDKGRGAFFCPRDANPSEDRTDTLVSLAGVFKLMDDSGAGVKLMLVDACRDDPKATRGIDASAIRVPKGVASLFSCSAGERAYEVEKYRHGAFFYHVLEVLRGKHPKALNKNGEVTWDGLQLVVRDLVSDAVPEVVGDGARQTPTHNAVELSGKSPALLKIGAAAGGTEEDGSAEFAKGLAAFLGKAGKIDYAAAAKSFLAAAKKGHVEGQAYSGFMLDNGYGVERDFEAAAEWYRKAAGQKSSAAQAWLGFLSLNGQGVGKDEKEAARLFDAARPGVEQAAAGADPYARNVLAALHAGGHGGLNKSAERAFAWYGKAADLGFPPALNRVAQAYADGDGVAKDEKKAAELYARSADRGDPDAMTALGALYTAGQGVAKDEKKAVELFRKAAALGDAEGAGWLGSMYRDGRGVELDEKEAVRWYRKAADGGSTNGMMQLGWMHADGKGGLVKDEERAVKLFRKSADLGDADGMTALGTMYAEGRGVEKDEKEAAKWYGKAADLGNGDGTNGLANLYRDGLGVDKDEKKAAELYQKALDQGHDWAAVNLGNLYAGGTGVDKDEKKAVELYRKAAEHDLGRGASTSASCTRRAGGSRRT